jgi:hypothetical protein
MNHTMASDYTTEAAPSCPSCLILIVGHKACEKFHQGDSS